MPAGKDASDRPHALTATVWIEDAGSRIARGEADVVTSDGMHVRLTEPPAFGSGDEVAVRLSFERGKPTVAITARVGEIVTIAGSVECSLAWSGPEAERRALDVWLERAA